MSDNAQIMMGLDPLTEDARAQIVKDITGWLERDGLITPSTRPAPDRDEFGVAAWAPGPNWGTVVDFDPQAAFESLMHNGVDLTAEVEMQAAFANAEDATCGRCGVALPADEFFGDLIDDWLTASEPTATCSACHWTAPLGDWPTQFPTGPVGAPTITFHNWVPLRTAFVDDLIARMGGGRCRYSGNTRRHTRWGQPRSTRWALQP